jgi:DNA-binding transcriptional LysR family regulator
MDTRLLRSFITLAETLNFTRSAELSYMTQPTFSRQIERLEEEFGIPLFKRSNRDVSLTVYGKAFLEDAKKMLTMYETTKEHMALIKSGNSGILNIGFLRDCYLGSLADAVKKYRTLYRNVQLRFHDCSQDQCLASLLNGSSDVVVALCEGMDNFSDFNTMELSSNHTCIVLQNTHRLADKPVIYLKDVRHDDFVVMNPAIAEVGYQQTLQQCMARGFLPNIVGYADSIISLMMLVECGTGISILPQNTGKMAAPGVKFIPIAENNLFASKTVLVWKKNDTGTCLENFVRCCSNLEK